MKIGVIVVIVIALAAMMAGNKYMNVRDDLITQRKAMTAAWSSVDLTLQGPANLIPDLVKMVQAFAPRETEVFKNVADARAALALGASYDPDVLKKLGVLGVVGDAALAREWYTKASGLGSREAEQRLELMVRAP